VETIPNIFHKTTIINNSCGTFISGRSLLKAKDFFSTSPWPWLIIKGPILELGHQTKKKKKRMVTLVGSPSKFKYIGGKKKRRKKSFELGYPARTTESIFKSTFVLSVLLSSSDPPSRTTVTRKSYI
jgi:hypothetical protein